MTFLEVFLWIGISVLIAIFCFWAATLLLVVMQDIFNYLKKKFWK